MAGSGRKEDLDPADKVHGEEHSEVHGGAWASSVHSRMPQWGASTVSGWKGGWDFF